MTRLLCLLIAAIALTTPGAAPAGPISVEVTGVLGSQPFVLRYVADADRAVVQILDDGSASYSNVLVDGPVLFLGDDVLRFSGATIRIVDGVRPGQPVTNADSFNFTADPLHGTSFNFNLGSGIVTAGVASTALIVAPRLEDFQVTFVNLQRPGMDALSGQVRQITAVPEPLASGLTALGLLAIGLHRRSRGRAPR